ncbi:hypothetical protein ACLOJK_017100 [Asimina triloba]
MRTYWHALEGISCFLWYKLKNTKRVYRGRHRHLLDVEEGYTSRRASRERRSVRERREDRMQRSLHPSRHRSKFKYWRRVSHHHMRWKMSDVSVRLKNSSQPHNSRQQLPKSNAAAIVRRHRRRNFL